MKEVTRIHIAKISYDIDIAAKKKLESYIEALSAYAEDENVLEDIEIRITELLDERGVKTNGMIGLDDVSAIRKTLGEPSDFSDEGDMAIGVTEGEGNSSRKLYRDIDSAVLGGVLGGVANFFKVNALWVRLAFIILLLISFGLAALLYVVLWIAIPAAKTVTEKLQMRGEPVTLSAIRTYNEGHEGAVSTAERLRMRRKGFGIFFGILGVFGVISGVIVTVTAAIAWRLAVGHWYDFQHDWLIFGLIIASGLLFTSLAALVARSGFIARLSKQGIIIGLAIMTVGVMTSLAAGGLISYEVWQREETIKQSMSERAITLPTNFSEAKTLTVSAEYASIDYRVSDDFRATIDGLPGASASLKQEGAGAVLEVKDDRLGDGYRYRSSIVIYGPKLDSIVADNGMVQYTAKTQDLEVSMTKDANLSLFGTYGRLTANVQSGTLNAEGASIKDSVIKMQPDTSVILGNIDSLNVSHPTACPNGTQASLRVESIRSDSFIYNGVQAAKADREDPCGVVVIGPEGNLLR